MSSGYRYFVALVEHLGLVPSTLMTVVTLVPGYLYPLLVSVGNRYSHSAHT